jgi:hypothetical protein
MESKMSQYKRDEMKQREFAFYLAILVGLLYLMFGKWEFDYSFGIMIIFQGLFNAMRYRYRKYPFDWWGPEVMEGLSWVAFMLPGFLLGWIYLYPIGIAIGSILASLIWFIFWKLWIEEYIYNFWR